MVLVPKQVPDNLLPLSWPGREGKTHFWAAFINSINLENDVLYNEGSETPLTQKSWNVLLSPPVLHNLSDPQVLDPILLGLIQNPWIFWAKTRDKEVYKMTVKMGVAASEKDQFHIFLREIQDEFRKLLSSGTVCAFPVPQGITPELEPCKGWILLLTITAKNYLYHWVMVFNPQIAFAVKPAPMVIHCVRGGSARWHRVGADFILSYFAPLWNREKAHYSELGLILLLKAQKCFQYLQPCKSRRLKKYKINHTYKEESIIPPLKGAEARLSTGLLFLQ